MKSKLIAFELNLKAEPPDYQRLLAKYNSGERVTVDEWRLAGAPRSAKQLERALLTTHPRELMGLKPPVWGAAFKTALNPAPLAHDGSVYFGGNDGNLYAYDLETGKEKWRFHFTRSDSWIGGNQPVYHEGVLYFTGENGFLYALDPKSGEEKWKQKLGQRIDSEPVIHNGYIYVGTCDGYLHALSLLSERGKDLSIPVGHIKHAPVIVDDVLYVAGDAYEESEGEVKGGILALDTKTKKVLWQKKTDDEFVSSPSVIKGKVYLAYNGWYLMALDARSGKRLWSNKLLGRCNYTHLVSLIGETAYSNYNDKEGAKLRATHLPTQKILWETLLDGNLDGGKPLVAEGKVLVGDEAGMMQALDQQSGRVLWRYRTNGQIRSSTPCLARGAVCFGSGDGRFYVIDAATGEDHAGRIMSQSALSFCCSYLRKNNERYIKEAFLQRWEEWVGQLKHEDPICRRQAVELLGYGFLRQKGIKEKLSQLLHDPDDGVRQAAEKALAHVKK